MSDSMPKFISITPSYSKDENFYLNIYTIKSISHYTWKEGGIFRKKKEYSGSIIIYGNYGYITTRDTPLQVYEKILLLCL